MIILIEGADGVGKTTLSNAIVLEFDAKYIHATWSRLLDCRMLLYHMNILLLAFLTTEKNCQVVVLDRLWLSLSVYAEVFRNGSRYPYHGRMILHFINSIGGISILCLADPEKHKKQFNKCKLLRWLMYSDVTKVVDLYNMFWEGRSLFDVRKLNDTYMKHVIIHGGAIRNPNYIKYDMLDLGKDIPQFLNKIKTLLLNRNGGKHEKTISLKEKPELDTERCNLDFSANKKTQ